jgi:hypothetical protein
MRITPRFLRSRFSGVLCPLILCTALAAVAAARAPAGTEDSIPIAFDLRARACADAPLAPGTATVRIAGQRITFRMELWRDAMPPREEPGPLSLSLDASTSDSRGLPNDFVITSARLTYRRSTWRPQLLKVPTFASDPAHCLLAAHNGPLWPIGARAGATLSVRAGGRRMLVSLTPTTVVGAQ